MKRPAEYSNMQCHTCWKQTDRKKFHKGEPTCDRCYEKYVKYDTIHNELMQDTMNTIISNSTIQDNTLW